MVGQNLAKGGKGGKGGKVHNKQKNYIIFQGWKGWFRKK